jgi:hypothetical protein
VIEKTLMVARRSGNSIRFVRANDKWQRWMRYRATPRQSEAATALGLLESDTRAIPAADPNNRLEWMQAIVQTANVEGETIALKEVIPFWFAGSSPLLGMLLGLLGAWFVTWLSA